jgi:uncharacterized protein
VAIHCLGRGTGYWLVKTGEPAEPGIDGGLLQRRGGAPGEAQPINAFPCTVGVQSVDETLARLLTLGGVVAVPRMALLGVGWLAYGKDTEGNILGLHQVDANAR